MQKIQALSWGRDGTARSDACRQRKRGKGREKRKEKREKRKEKREKSKEKREIRKQSTLEGHVGTARRCRCRWPSVGRPLWVDEPAFLYFARRGKHVAQLHEPTQWKKKRGQRKDKSSLGQENHNHSHERTSHKDDEASAARRSTHKSTRGRAQKPPTRTRSSRTSPCPALARSRPTAAAAARGAATARRCCCCATWARSRRRAGWAAWAT